MGLGIRQTLTSLQKRPPGRSPPYSGVHPKGIGEKPLLVLRSPGCALRPQPPAAPAPAPVPAAIHAPKRTPKGKSDTSVSHRAKHWKHEIADVDQDHPGSSRGGGGGCARALCGAAPGRGRGRRRGCGSRRGGRRSAGRGRRWGGGWRGDRWPMERLPSRPLSTFKGAGAAAAATQRRAQPMGAERSAARPRRNRGGQRGPRARGWLGEGGVTAEREPTANHSGLRPGAEGGGGQPRGTRGAQRGCVASRRPEHARVKCPAHRHGQRAHATCTHREGRAPKYAAVRSCVRRDRHEGTKCTRPGGPCTPRTGHSGTCAWSLAHVQSLTAGTSEAGRQASSRTQNSGAVT